MVQGVNEAMEFAAIELPLDSIKSYAAYSTFAANLIMVKW